MGISMLTCNVFARTCESFHTCVRMCMCIYIYIILHMHFSMHVHIYIYMYIYIYVYIYAGVCTCTYICVCVQKHMHTGTFMCTYVYYECVNMFCMRIDVHVGMYSVSMQVSTCEHRCFCA